MQNKNILVLLLSLLCTHFAYSKDSTQISFAFITDAHVSPQAASEQALKDIVSEINTLDIDFVLFTGDLTNNGSDAELQAVKKALSPLKVPVYVISGNHETNWSESAGASFHKLWGDDRFVFEFGPYLFIGFATGPYMKMGDGQIKAEDLYWLKSELQKRYTPNKIVIAAAHYPLGDGLANWHEATDILNQYNVSFALCGHGHRLSIYNFDGIPGIMGRAVLEKGSDTPGYNIVNLKNGRAYIHERAVGKLSHTILDEDPFVSFPLSNRSEAQTIFSQSHPDTLIRNSVAGVISAKRLNLEINQQYPNAPIQLIHTDSASIFTGAVSDHQHVVYGTSTGRLVAWDITKQATSWTKNLGGSIYSTPSLYQDRKNTVLQGTIEGWLYAFDLTNGKPLWKLDLGKAIISEGTVRIEASTNKSGTAFFYIGAGNVLYKIDIRKGQIVWRTNEIEGQLQGKPTVTNKHVVLGAWDTYLYCINTQTGKVEWKWNNGKKGVLLSPANVEPMVNQGAVFIVAPDRYMTAIDLKDGHTLWRTNTHKVRESMGASADGKTVYAKLMNDSIVAVAADGTSFKTLWAVDAGFGYEHNPCPIVEHEGTIYAGGKNGLLVAIDAKTLQVKWKHQCGFSAINKISVEQIGYKNQGAIWVSLIEGKILRMN